MTPFELRQRIAAFAREVAAFTKPLLKSIETQDAARQLRRSSSSVAANHRAAGTGQSHGDFTAKLAIAATEADESLYWLKYLRDSGAAPTRGLAPLLQEAKELSAILAASFATAKAREEAAKQEKQRRHRRF